MTDQEAKRKISALNKALNVIDDYTVDHPSDLLEEAYELISALTNTYRAVIIHNNSQRCKNCD